MGDDDYSEFILSALRRYSKDKPRLVISDITGTASKFIEVNASNFPNFVDGFSRIEYLEAGAATIADNEKPNYIERDSWDYYRDTTKLYVYFKDDQPATSDTIRAQYTAEHTINGLSQETVDTVPGNDFEAIIYWAAHEACLALAAKMSDTINPGIRGEQFNSRSKSKEYREVAQKYQDLYMNWVTEPNEAASVTRDLDFGYSFVDGMPWQTHRSFRR